MPRVYIVEDDEPIREFVEYALRSAGWEASGFETGADFFAAMENAPPNLVLLDIMLPGDDGLALLKQLRSTPQTKTLPVILLSAKGSEVDKVKGLDMGADDYITKPFGVMELISRVNALSRRAAPAEPEAGVLEYGGLLLNPARRLASVNGEAVSLTYKEYELLHYLVLNKELALSRDKLMEAVWDYDFEGGSRTLDMHIGSLRQKLGAAGDYIKTIRSVGYMFGA
ncbi:MAG: response regulator transcription factor [Oscillospiraceae bacterium]|nr:response regulator transcription factor [Oscillospiraceae bacterium]